MASAGDRLQIVIGAKDELSSQLRQTRKELTTLGRTANDIQRRIESGEQGLQNEYEQTRREIQRVTTEHKDLARKQSEVNREFRDMTTSSRRAGAQMTQSMDRAGREMGITNSKANRLQRTTGSLRSGWAKFAGVAAAVTGAVVGLSGAFQFLSSSVSEARQARKAMQQTEAVMRSMGRTEAPERLEKMINSLEDISGIDGDNIREMTNILLTFGNVTDDTFITANKLALDLSVAFGKDLNSSAVMVGKALNDPAKGLTALSRVGVSFTAQQQEQVKSMMEVGDIAGAQKIIIGELTKQVGGSAAAQADGIAKAQVAWGNLKEAIGDTLLASAPGWDVTASIKSATRWIKQNQGEIKEVLLTIAGSAMRVGEAFLRMGAVVAFAWGQILLQMVPVLKVVGIFIPKADEMATSLTNTALSAIDASKKMRLTADGMGDLADKTFTARDRVKELNDVLRNIKSKKVRLDVRTTLTDAFSAVDAAVQRANDAATRFAGGPVMPGSNYLVGEIGPELFVPNAGEPRMVGMGGPEVRDFHTSGTIIPTAMVGSYMASHAAQVAAPAAVAPAGGGVHIESLVVQDRFDARREFESLMAKQRRIAAERS